MPGAMTLWPEWRATDTFSYERALRQHGYVRIAGTDEVGRGPLAGPVVAACVVLPADCEFQKFQDSKKLSPAVRVQLADELERLDAMIGIGIVSAAEIDRLNILQASLLAMRQAVEALPAPPDFLLVDGKFTVPLPIDQQPLVKGDSRSASVAAASIVAKVKRDAMMAEYHLQFPAYNFTQHKGYPTAEHCRLLRKYGPCAIHRQSFRPVRDCLAQKR